MAEKNPKTGKADHWARLELWLKRNLPEVLADLKPGATEKQIAGWEKKMKCVLPDELRALYRRHDRQKGKASGPFYGLALMSLSAMHGAWKLSRDLLLEDPDGMRELADARAESHPKGAIKRDYLNPGWIPFAHDHGGNFLGVDLDPGPKGTRGQVINFGRDEDKSYVLAPSFDAFVAWLVPQLERGNFILATEGPDADDRSFNTKLPKTRHFLSSVPKLFGGKR